MTYLNSSIQTQIYNPVMSNVFQLRFGEREISIRQDFRKHLYYTNPIVECRAGERAGHLEILFLRRWLVVFNRVQ